MQEWRDEQIARAEGVGVRDERTIGTDLRRVIPVASQDLGRGIRVLSVEIYDQGLVVRWYAAPPLDTDSSVDGTMFAVSDDVGTTYDFFSGGSFGHLDSMRGDSLYVPAPPATATVLAIEAADDAVPVRLKT